MVTLIVYNKTDAPRSFAGELVVEDVTAQQTGTRPTQMQPNQARPVQVIRPATTTKKVVEQKPPPRRVTFASVDTRRLVKAPSPAATPMVMPQNRPQAQSQGQSQQIQPAQPARFTGTTNTSLRHEKEEGLDMVLPNPGEKTLLLLKGHAHGLLTFLEHGAPIHRSFRPSITRQCMSALSREGAVAMGDAEVLILLTAEQIMMIAQLTQKQRGPLSDDEKIDIIAAIKDGIERDEALARRAQGQPQASPMMRVAAGV
jgi:hypothetical protein